MNTDEPRDLMENHGIALDKEKKRVRCNYCAKEVNGFCRLKHHLGALGSDVVACEAVPDDVKAQMKNSLLEKKKERLLKEVGEIYHPDLPLKRNLSPKANETKSCSVKPLQLQTSVKGKKVMDSEMERCPTPHPGHLKRNFPPGFHELDRNRTKSTKSTTLEHEKKLMKPLPEKALNGNSNLFYTKNDMEMVFKEEIKEETASHASRCIAQFLYEAGLDLTVVKYPSFQRMIDAAICCGTGYKLPRLEELNGWILQREVEEVQGHIEEVKKSWARTGCSILLDGWTDERGRSLVSFLVDCPQGTVFLKSVDASGAIQDVDALSSLLSGVVEEVGVQNVVQVVSHGTSCYMEAAGKKLMEKHMNLFWTLSADYCINLILEKIGNLDHVKKVLAEAKDITKFIYSHALPLELMRKHMHGKNLVRTSNLKCVSPFATLENMMSERENLIAMFSSPRWTVSVWASRTKGRAVANLVKEPLFWAAADEVLKATIPLIAVLRWKDGDDKISMGCIYEAMDRAKELIRTNLENDEAKFMPLWNTIDEIWDNYLHSPLHSAGYYLNPSLFYSNDFFVDAEVANGLLSCIIRMVEDRQKQDLIFLQLDAYRAAMGVFGEEKAVDQRTKVPASSWWLLYGGGTPELQSFAIKVLGQTCRGAAMHKFQRTLSEKLHTNGRNCMEQERLHDIEYVHYNLRLWRSPMLGKDPVDHIILEDIDPMDDSVVEG